MHRRCDWRIARSHDLRTPLIEEHVDRLAELVTNVLDLSRIRAGGVTLDMEINTAEDLVGAAISRASGIARDKRIVPHIDLREPAVIGHFDFVQSLRVLGNLLDNAIRYSPPNGVVDVGVRRDGSWIEISVSDYGPGIPLAERERIFEPFYRPRSDAPDVGHAGLGLSIAITVLALLASPLALHLWHTPSHDRRCDHRKSAQQALPGKGSRSRYRRRTARDRRAAI